MKIHRGLQQGSWNWLCARGGKVTGSEIKNLITDKMQVRKWNTDMPNTYLHRKLAEKWRGQALESFQGNRQTDQGKFYEEQARKFFSSLLDSDIESVGGIESDDGACWCSPDGLVSDRAGLEIKCPNPDTHTGWLLSGIVPEEHVLQVQFGLWVSGFEQWQFLSWCKDFPHLAVPVEPVLTAFKAIETAVGEFLTRMAQAWARLIEMNGGPPTPRQFVPSSPEPIKYSWEYPSEKEVGITP